MTDNLSLPNDASTASDTQGPARLPAAAAAAVPPPRSAAEFVDGTAIGRYVILGKVGAGGMGVVYAAYDRQLDRKVALKFVHVEQARGSDPARLSRMHDRLLTEAHALARLTHPNVVRIYDVGSYEDRVYLSMEFVEGQTLRAWLAERPRPWSEILRVMLAVGRGLAAAHAANLVHRDLKPGNIMIARDGQVRVMDFGLACANPEVVESTLREGDGDASLDDAASGRNSRPLLGTPGYMAPEQLKGQNTTARADQFSFCVTLWEALYGQRPFQGEPPAQLAHNVISGTIVEPRGRRGVPRWLRPILDRGLRVRAEERWPTMAALLDALEQGAARRRWRQVAGGAAILAMVAAGAWAKRGLDVLHQRESCSLEAHAIDSDWNPAVRQALVDGFVATDAPYAADSAERTASRLDHYAARWSAIREPACVGANVNRTVDSVVYALRADCLDERRQEFAALVNVLSSPDQEVLANAVESAASLPSLEMCADETWLRQRVRPPEDAAMRERVKELRAELTRAAALRYTGQHAAALQVASESLERAEAVGWRPAIADAGLLVGALQDDVGEPKRAVATLLDAYVTAGAVAHDEVAAAIAAEIAWVQGDTLEEGQDALVWVRLAQMTLERIGQAEGWRAADLADARAVIHVGRGQLEDAQREGERALALRETTLGSDHPGLAATLSNLAATIEARGSYEEAQRLHERALALREAALGPRHPALGHTLSNLGVVLNARGNLTDAVAAFDRALTLFTDAYGSEHPSIAMVLNNRAMVERASGRNEEARALHERALRIRELRFGLDHPLVGESLINLASLSWASGDYEAAVAANERALGILEKTKGPEHPAVATALNNLASVHGARGAHDQAIPLFERALAIREKTLGSAHPDFAQTLDNLGIERQARREYGVAKQLHERGLLIREATLGLDHPDVGISLTNLGRALAALGEYEAAAERQRRALALWERSLGPDHPFVSFAAMALAEIELERADPAASIPYAERALAIRKASGSAPALVAEVEFVLARALWAARRNRTRARALALSARAAYVRLGAEASTEAAAVAAWLRRHGAR